MNVAIAGLGNIAEKVSRTINKLNDENIVLYACFSRNMEKAEKFCRKFRFKKAYGSYERLLSDPNVDLVYIATPHPCHYPMAKLAIEAKKNVLVEKPVSTDKEKFGRLIGLAKEKNVFFCEAFQTAFNPLVLQLREQLNSGEFGRIISVRSSFGIPLTHVKRMTEPTLGGGALLDLGVYCILHSVLYSNAKIKSLTARSEMYKTGVDKQTFARIEFDDYSATFKCSFSRFFKNEVIIQTTKYVIRMPEISFPKKLIIKDRATGKKNVKKLKCITGYEFQFLEIAKCLAEKRLYTRFMPHKKSAKVLSVCDEIRRQISLSYPFD